VIVAPNLDLSSWTSPASGNVVEVVALELVNLKGQRQVISLLRPVFVVAQRVPRAEMRGFLEQCEDMVVATGDQSVAEAVLLGKMPMVRPDAKVAQWELALAAMARRSSDEVPDLGAKLRELLSSEEVRVAVAAQSKARSLVVQQRVDRELGKARTDRHEVLIRAGMYG